MKKKKVLLGLLAGCFLLICMSVPVYADEDDKDVENNDFSVTVDAGLDGIAVEGKAVPVSVTVANSGKDFVGTLRLIIPATYDVKSLAFEKGIAIPSGSEKTISMLLPYLSNSTGMIRIELENEKGKAIYSNRESIKPISVGQMAVVGVLSDDYTALNYFDAEPVETGYTMVSSKIIQLTAANIPQTAKGLETCDYILIDNYNTSQLTQEQCNAIMNWVADGGMLIFGTGSKASVTLEGFQDVIGPISIGNLNKKSILLTGGIAEEAQSVDAASLSMEGWENVESDIAAGAEAWKCGYGNGTMLILSYDLTMEPISSWKEQETLASNILQSAGNDLTFTKLCYGGDSQYNSWTMERLVNSVDENKLPNALLYAGIFLIYVIGIGPVSYLILKAKDKREKIWIVMPAIALGCTILVYLTSMMYHIYKPFIDAVHIVKYNNHSVVTDTYMSIQSPKGREYAIDFAEGYQDIEGWQQDVDYEEFDTTDFTCAVVQEGNTARLRVNQTKAFEPQSFNIKKEEIQEGIGFDINLTCHLTDFEGTVTNNTGHDLENVVVVYRDMYAAVGDMKNGDTVEIGGLNGGVSVSGINTSYYYYDIIQQEWMDESAEDHWFDVDRTTYRRLLINERMYSVAEEMCDSLAPDQGIVFGMIDGYEEDLLQNNNAKVYSAAMAVSYFYEMAEEYKGTSLYVEDINDYMVGGPLMPYDSMYPEGYDIFYDTDTRQVYTGSGGMSVVDMTVLYDFYSLDLSDAVLLEWPAYDETSLCGVQLYNYTTQQYDDVFQEKDVYTVVDDLTPYLDENNWMIIKYVIPDGKDTYEWYAPQISIGGELE